MTDVFSKIRESERRVNIYVCGSIVMVGVRKLMYVYLPNADFVFNRVAGSGEK